MAPAAVMAITKWSIPLKGLGPGHRLMKERTLAPGFIARRALPLVFEWPPARATENRACQHMGWIKFRSARQATLAARANRIHSYFFSAPRRCSRLRLFKI
jgi:hypothetical protein